MGDVSVAPPGTGPGDAGWARIGRTPVCLGCGDDLVRLTGEMVGDDGVGVTVVLRTAVRCTLLVVDGVRFRGRIPEGDPMRDLAVAREPFCAACYAAAPDYAELRRG